jgi:hypothetical protein
MSGGPAVLAGQRATAVVYNQNVAGPWNAFSLQNGWTNKGVGTVTAQYRMVNTVTVEIIGTILPGTITNNTVVFTLPTGYYNPNNSQVVPLIVRGSAAAAVAWLSINIDGTCGVVGAVASTSYAFHDLISLDA